jgi:3-hydroxyacyl-[acyl-carrier-protein] dehydratase
VNLRDCIAAALVGAPVNQPDGTWLCEFKFPAADPVFAGHFPGRPLVPGIFQIELVQLAAETILRSSLELRTIDRAKFLRPILPEENIRLHLKLAQKNHIITTRARLVVGGQAAGEAVIQLWRKELEHGSSAAC